MYCEKIDEEFDDDDDLGEYDATSIADDDELVGDTRSTVPFLIGNLLIRIVG